MLVSGKNLLLVHGVFKDKKYMQKTDCRPEFPKNKGSCFHGPGCKALKMVKGCKIKKNHTSNQRTFCTVHRGCTLYSILGEQDRLSFVNVNFK